MLFQHGYSQRNTQCARGQAILSQHIELKISILNGGIHSLAQLHIRAVAEKTVHCLNDKAPGIFAAITLWVFAHDDSNSDRVRMLPDTPPCWLDGKGCIDSVTTFFHREKR